MASNWYAVYVRSRHESKVCSQLQSKGVEVFLPLVEKLRQWKDRKKRVAFPLFPGYLFIKLVNDNVQFINVLKVQGVVKILGDSSGYKPVPQEQVDAIYKMVHSKCDIDEHPYLKEGQKVRITDGPLMGIQGILVSKDKEHHVVVSIDILQKGVSVKVDIHDVEPIL
ncbi:MAG: UpxY family transcription antiterminator [Spirochaetes bacterium]|nr:UpxY family transcription antiterminator [Spirochaetota bacterium]